MRRTRIVVTSAGRFGSAVSRAGRATTLLAALALAVAACLAVPSAAPTAQPKQKPKKSTSKTLQSHKATEAIAQKAGIRRTEDADPEHRSTLRPPLPVYSSPGGDPSITPPVLFDQFEDDYYAGGSPPPPPAAATASDTGVFTFSKAIDLEPAMPLAAPYPEFVWRNPVDGGVWNGQGGNIDFHDKYVDPDGANGWLWFSVWQPNVGNVMGTPVQGSLSVSGGQSTWFVGTSLASGWYVWTEWAQDVTGEQTPLPPPSEWEWDLYVNRPPNTPTPVSPQAGATVPTPQPVLSITGANWSSPASVDTGTLCRCCSFIDSFVLGR